MPEPEPARAAPGSENLPTMRVPVALPAPAEPFPAVTPPPRGRLAPLSSAPLGIANLSGSDWSSEWDDDGESPFPGSRRAPRVGDTVLGFKLVGELGRGAFARVYLAHQESLANRPVALKVTLRPTHEAERLARLQHTNIVPVYSVHNDGPVQVLCMPFLGKVTIADLLRVYRSDPSRVAGRRSTVARAARTTLTTDSKSVPASNGRSGAPRVPVWTWDSADPPPIVGDPRAVVQALVQLAEGLAHAHERGILHLDLKPANVLLADTGEPMLLDFNLSFDAARPDRELVGGTMPYMAIEQLLDMRNRGTGTLDQRTDLYALGAMAFEMLTGGVPFAPTAKGLRDIDGQVALRRQGPPALRPLNPAVTPAVEAIVRKLLAAEPEDRYQSAEQLRTDLERQLNDQPLRYARETSVTERLGKWRRRNPGLTLRLMAACLIGLALGLGGILHQRAEATARVGAVEQARTTRAALDTVRLDLILYGDKTTHERGEKRAEELLAAYGLPGDADWQKRPEVSRLTEIERSALTADLGELLLLLAQSRWQGFETRPESERRERAAQAWKLNRAARTCFDANAVPAVLDRQAALIAPAVGEVVDVPNPAKVPGAHTEFIEAAFALMSGRYATAVPLLDRAIADQPAHGAAQFCLAYCRQQLGQYTRALERYDVARVLLPKDPRPALQRGAIYGLCKKPALAEAEFTKAIDLDPGYAEAYRARGLTRYRLARADEARPGRAAAARAQLEAADKDYTCALERGASPLHIHLLRAAARDGRDPVGAKADRAAAGKLTATTEMDFLVRGTVRVFENPTGSLADFRSAEELNPRSLVALQNQAHVLADRLKEKDPRGALKVATRVVEFYPEFALGRSGRAVLLARLKDRDGAHKEIEQALLLSDDAEVSYQAACVYSLTSATNPEDKAKALEFLRQAVRDGYSNLPGLALDPDLEPVRKSKEFEGISYAANRLVK
ncbi:protein kinase domain-containing protein [Gemmata massiliana]|uniref:protein kinase domain-containing protein n=1 Tax=Gemmata massiliana TaxID=1210884 RepID=UPI0013A6EDE4|nr:protein kinase [Gemmata massiliana]